MCAVSSVINNYSRVWHGNGTVKYRGITAEMVIRTKSITAITAGMGTVRVVIPWEQESNFLEMNIDSNN